MKRDRESKDIRFGNISVVVVADLTGNEWHVSELTVTPAQDRVKSAQWHQAIGGLRGVPFESAESVFAAVAESLAPVFGDATSLT